MRTQAFKHLLAVATALVALAVTAWGPVLVRDERSTSQSFSQGISEPLVIIPAVGVIDVIEVNGFGKKLVLMHRVNIDTRTRDIESLRGMESELRSFQLPEVRSSMSDTDWTSGTRVYMRSGWPIYIVEGEWMQELSDTVARLEMRHTLRVGSFYFPTRPLLGPAVCLFVVYYFAAVFFLQYAFFREVRAVARIASIESRQCIGCSYPVGASFAVCSECGKSDSYWSGLQTGRNAMLASAVFVILSILSAFDIISGLTVIKTVANLSNTVRLTYDGGVAVLGLAIGGAVYLWWRSAAPNPRLVSATTIIGVCALCVHASVMVFVLPQWK